MTSPKFAKLRELALSRGTRIVTPKAEPSVFGLVGYWAGKRNDEEMRKE